ncbi:MAG: pyridoxamine 5'-phosphate oxidase family protein [Nitrososphaerales archaeon]
MPTEKEESLLREERVARLATFSKNGKIHLIPVCYAYDGKHIYVGTSLDSQKVKNLKRNSSVSLIVDRYYEDWSKLKGVMIQGSAEVIEEGEEFESAKKMLYQKYPQYEEQVPIREGESAIIKITVEKILSWDYEG